MPDTAAMEVIYRQRMEGGDAPDLVTIWCERCGVAHYASSKGGDICLSLKREIKEAQVQRWD